MQANVRSTDAIRELRTATLEWASRLDDQVVTLRGEARRALHWASVEQPQYWQRQVTLAERMLQEAIDRLAVTQTTYGGRDRPRATEAQHRVSEMRRRLRFCQERTAACRGWAAEMERAVAQLIAATSGLQQQADAGLPTAAAQLAQWIDALDRYADVRPAQPAPAQPAPAQPATAQPAPAQPAPAQPATAQPVQPGEPAPAQPAQPGEPGPPSAEKTS